MFTLAAKRVTLASIADIVANVSSALRFLGAISPECSLSISPLFFLLC